MIINEWGGKMIFEGGKIKPCPFCASEEIQFNTELTYLCCIKCSAEGPPGYISPDSFEKTQKLAVEKWNQRRVLLRGEIVELV